jgi:hypothetical protein
VGYTITKLRPAKLYLRLGACRVSVALWLALAAGLGGRVCSRGPPRNPPLPRNPRLPLQRRPLAAFPLSPPLARGEGLLLPAGLNLGGD